MKTPSQQEIALGLEAEWIEMLNRSVMKKSVQNIEQLREDVLVLTTEVETLFSLSVYELETTGEARRIAHLGHTQRALIKLHPIIYSRGRRD
ncbi:hypothetical protein [Caballeronia sp. M23-90]